MVKMPGYTLEGEQGPVRLADVFGGKSPEQAPTSTNCHSICHSV